MGDKFDYPWEQNCAVVGLPNIWTPKKGEIEEIIIKLKIVKQHAENARQEEIVRQQIVARQQELDQENAYYQAQMRNISRNMSPPPTYFMTTPNGTIHYYY